MSIIIICKIFFASLRCFCVCGCCTSVARQFSLLPGSDSLALLRSSSHYRGQIRLVLPSGLPHFQRNPPPGNHTRLITTSSHSAPAQLLCCTYETCLSDVSAGVHGTCHTATYYWVKCITHIVTFSKFMYGKHYTHTFTESF